MKKIMILIPALAFGASLVIASPTSDAVALQKAANDLASGYSTQIAAAKAIKDAAAVSTLTAANKAAALALRAEQAPVVAELIGSIDEIGENNPATAAWLIQRHLSERNFVDGATPPVYVQDSDDIALAAKLKTLGTGSARWYYYQWYGTADELAAFPGTNSAGIVAAIAKRAKQLGITDTVIPALYQRSLGLGLVSNGYNAWFNKRVRSVWATDRAAALKLLEEEQAGIGTLTSQTPATKARLEQLRELSARFAEIIARGN
ncbi:hypothetical protein OpiT1DRAFT_03963 [Opitutaceae bacterium TAV1]|nr:hypothetical protein OpiT1DRAFT_03963 [Opitutaceae bacterium TAV1]